MDQRAITLCLCVESPFEVYPVLVRCLGEPMKSEIVAIYPTYAVKRLRQRGQTTWHQLIDWIAGLPATQPESLAFTLMMRRMRALCDRTDAQCDDLACAVCAQQLVSSYGGSEHDLVVEFHRTLGEVKSFLSRQPARMSKAA